MLFYELAESLFVCCATECRYFIFKVVALYKFMVQTLVKVVVLVKHIRHSAAHSGAQIPPGAAKNYSCSACHVLKSVVTATFRNDCRTGVTHAEPLAGNTVYKSFSACCAEQRYVSDDDVAVSFA